VIRRRLWIVIICFVVATGVAVALTLRAENRYESTSGLLVTGGIEPQRNAETNLQLLTLPSIASRANQMEPAISQGEFESSISVSQVAESDIVHVSANSASPQTAARITNAYAEAFVEYRKEDHGKIAAGRVSLVQRAVPNDTPVSPKKAKNVGFGALIGIVLGLALALLLEQMDRRVKREEDLADTTGLSILATIPKRRSFDRKHFGAEPLSPAESEVFRLLRANLRYSKDRGAVDSVVVTSADRLNAGWGVRTLSQAAVAYNPFDYQTGAVWPHDTAMVAVGLRSYGFDDEALEIFTGLYEAATRFDLYRLPELFAGFDRVTYGRPVRYPVACSPQAWAAGSLPYLLTSVLGIVPDAFARTLHVIRPRLPEWLDFVEINGLTVGTSRVDLRFERSGDLSLAAVTAKSPDLQVKIEY